MVPTLQKENREKRIIFSYLRSYSIEISMEDLMYDAQQWTFLDLFELRSLSFHYIFFIKDLFLFFIK